MLIVKLETNSNGTRANQSLDFPLTNIPEGYAAVPEALEEEAKSYLPWLELELDEDGVINAVSENTEAKEAYYAALEAAKAAEGESESEAQTESAE